MGAAPYIIQRIGTRLQQRCGARQRALAAVLAEQRVGLVIATAEPDLLTALLEGQGEAVLRLGEVQGGFEGLRLPS